MSQLTNYSEWQALATHAQGLKSLHLTDLFAADKGRAQKFWTTFSSVSYDYSRQPLTHETISLLIALARKQQLPEKIKQLFEGGILNVSENKPALHMALRASSDTTLPLPKEALSLVESAKKQMLDVAKKVRNNNWHGASGKPITDIVNIGIGGSDLGPKLTVTALKAFTLNTLKYHFISDGDDLSFSDVAETLNPETTLFIVTSKSFSTPETIKNFKFALDFINHPQALSHQFIAITCNTQKAQQMGFQHILPIWDWVGGRYSMFSAVNLIGLIALGEENFKAYTDGAELVDTHFFNAPLAVNIPVLMALIGIWSINFMGLNTLALLSYNKRLEYLMPYIQQLDMESNGKRTTVVDELTDYHTGPIIWGGLGNRAQHAFYQSICQGTQKIPCDFILIDRSRLNHFAENKIKALSFGNVTSDILNQSLPGNIPLNVIKLANLSPKSLGELIALYEHKVFCQSVIWNINPFDQPGVESTKLMREANTINSEEAVSPT